MPRKPFPVSEHYIYQKRRSQLLDQEELVKMIPVDKTDDLFSTPTLRYLELKQNLMNTLMKPSVWPEENDQEFDGDLEITKRQILSINILLMYLEETEELVKSAPNEVLEIDVAIDNRVLVLREMPFPPQFKKRVVSVRVQWWKTYSK